jgi:MFS family permease
LAIGINIFLYGLSGPFAAALMERFGLRRTTLGGLTTIGVGVLATPSMHQPWHYGLRGLSLIYLPFAFVSFYGLSLFAVFYGLDWIATVPPTIRLTANTFGSEKTGMMYGWITAIHQLGGASAALLGGILRVDLGTYLEAFMLSGVLCLVAAAMVMLIAVKPVTPRALAAPLPA